MNFIQHLIRRLTRRSVADIVSPLKNIAEDLYRLREFNYAENKADAKKIECLAKAISKRDGENVKAANAEAKIRALFS